MKGCLTVIGIFIALLAGAGLLAWLNKDVITTGITKALEQPEYGKKEYIDTHYGDVLRSLDAAAGSSSSVFAFGTAVEGMALPDEVLYVGINKGENETDVIKRFDWNGSTFFTLSGYGSGTLSSDEVSKTIMIYKNEGPWDYMDEFVVYIEYKGGPEVTPPQQ